MRTFTFFLLLLVTVNITANDRGDTIQIHKKGSVGTHVEQNIPYVEPTVYYDNDERELTIVGTGCVGFYDVEISSVTTYEVYISTSIDGTFDTIDLSLLPDDDYIITIDTPVNVSFEGYFSVY